MPTLDWIGKKAVVNHHREVPYRLVHCDGELSAGDADAGNLLVQGDNLEALKALLPYYAGKVKCIYIDPPYNTGNEGWVYNDNVNSPEIKAWLGNVVGKEAEDLSRHDKWLCMMYPRLRLLREFLREDGVIFVSIDDFALRYLSILLETIFGEGNSIATLVWEKSRKNDAKHFSVGHEYVVCFAKNFQHLKNNNVVWREKTEGMQIIAKEYRRLKGLFNNDIGKIEKHLREYYSSLEKNNPAKKYVRYNKVDREGVWRDDNMSWPGGSGPRYELLHPKTGEPCAIPPGGWRYSTKEKMQRMVNEGKVVFREDHTEPPIRKTYLTKSDSDSDDDGKKVMTSYFFRSSLQASTLISDIFGFKAFDYPKDHEVISRLIDYVTNPDDLILDSFAGSGTTGHAVLDLNKQDGGNRKFILVEMDEQIAPDITAERLKRVINGYDKGGDASKPVEGLGGGFRYCRLGVPLFNEFGDIDGGVTFPDLAAHVFFAECGVPISAKATGNSPYLGQYQDKAVYLLFSPSEPGFAREASGNVLTPDMLASLPTPPDGFEGGWIVYGEGCTVGKERLAEAGVTFKQIPYQIEGA